MASIPLAFESTSSISALSFSQGDFIAHPIEAANEDGVLSYQELRYEWFVLRRSWVQADPATPNRETDRYDPYCHHLGVFQEGRLVAYIRALPWQTEPGLMLQHEFHDLVSEESLEAMAQPGAVELSRLIVAPPPGSSRNSSFEIAELLFKLVYLLGKRLSWNTYYIVLEEAWLRVLNRRFHLPFAPIGQPHTYPDGTKTLAAFTTCLSLEETMLLASPDKHRWYRQELNP